MRRITLIMVSAASLAGGGSAWGGTPTGDESLAGGALDVCQAALSRSQLDLGRREHLSALAGLSPEDARSLLAAAEERASKAELELKLARQQLQKSKDDVVAVTRAALAGEASREEALEAQRQQSGQKAKENDTLVAQMKLRMDDLLAERDQLERQVASAKNDPAYLAQHDALTADLVAARNRATDLARRNGELEEKTGAMGVQLAALQEGLASANQTNAKRDAEADSAAAAKAADLKVLTDTRAAAARAADDLAATKTALGDARKKAVTLEDDVARRDQALGDAQAKVLAEREAARTARAEVDRLGAEVALLRTRATEARLRTHVALSSLAHRSAEAEASSSRSESAAAGKQDLGSTVVPAHERSITASKADEGPTITARSVAQPETEAAIAITQADTLIKRGDVAEARLLLRWALHKGSAEAALRLGDLYDPGYLASIHAVGVKGDVRHADALYRRAARNGSRAAQARLNGSDAAVAGPLEGGPSPD